MAKEELVEEAIFCLIRAEITHVLARLHNVGDLGELAANVEEARRAVRERLVALRTR